MRKELDLNVWKVLACAQAKGSITAGAMEAGVSPSTAIRMVESLEKSMKFKLFHRKVKPFQLTEYAKHIIVKIEPVINAQERILVEASEEAHSLKGLIRLSTPIGHAHRNIVPIVDKFLTLYPEIDFQIVIGKQVEDVLKGKVDVALVAGKIPEDGVVARLRDHSVFIPVASPKYIQAYGQPQHPSDLRYHRGLVYCGNQRSKTTQLTRNHEKCNIVWKKSIEIADILAVKEGVVGSLGIAVDIPIAHCAQELLDGKLVPILNGWRRPTIECFVIASNEGYRIRRIREFVDWFSSTALQSALERDRKVANIVGLQWSQYEP